MSGRQRGKSALGEERDEAQPALGDRLAYVCDVDAPAQDGLLLLVPIEPLHFDRHLRVLGGEGSDCWCHQDSRAKADDKVVSASSGALNATTSGVGGGEQRAGVVQQLSAGGGQPDGAFCRARRAWCLTHARARRSLGSAPAGRGGAPPPRGESGVAPPPRRSSGACAGQCPSRPPADAVTVSRPPEEVLDAAALDPHHGRRGTRLPEKIVILGGTSGIGLAREHAARRPRPCMRRRFPGRIPSSNQ
jgi:hypothetical protein